MIDYDIILRKYIDIARDALGSKLSTVKFGANRYPSVVRAGESKTLPDYPFVTIDIVGTEQTKGWLLYEGVDENDNPYYETDYTITLQYTIHGDDAYQLGNELEGYFRLPSVRDGIRADTQGALVNTTNVVPVSNTLPNRIKDSSFFTFTHSVVDVLTDTGGFVADSVGIEGAYIPQTEVEL